MATLRLESPAFFAAAAAVVDSLSNQTTTTPISIITNTIIGKNNSGSSFIDKGSDNMTLIDTNDGTHNFYKIPPVNLSDNNTGNWSHIWIPPVYIMVWITITNVLVFLVGVIGNLLVIVVVLFVREMKTSTNLCLMNLSVADLLVIIICQPSSMLEFYANEKWLIGRGMCKFVAFLENMVTVVSILIIICVSLERFWAVYYPLKTYSSGSKSKAMILMLVVWVTGAVATCPYFVMARTDQRYHYLDQKNVTICETPIYENWHEAYVVSRFVLVFAVPLIMLTFLYCMIAFKVVNKPMESKRMTESARAQAQQNRRQLVTMLVGIVVLFFVCLLPFRVYTFWFLFAPQSDFSSLSPEANVNILYFVRLLIYVNSAGNPIIYHLVSTKFRRAFQRVLRMYCPCLAKFGLGAGVHANGTYSHATRLTTMSHYSVAKHNANDYSESVDAV